MIIVFYLWKNYVDSPALCGKHDIWELELGNVWNPWSLKTEETGRGFSCKIANKVSALVSKPRGYLEDFGIESLQDSCLVCAKKYLVRVISQKLNCETKVWNLEDERESSERTFTYIKHHSWTFAEEPLLCVLMLKPLGSCNKILQPANYGWIIENWLLFLTKNFATLPSYLTTKCRCKKGCRKNCGCKRTFKKYTEYYNCRNCESE